MLSSPLYARVLFVSAALAAITFIPSDNVEALQQGNVAGRVVDGQSLQPLSVVQVFILDLNRGSLTEANGGFVLAGVPAGQHTVQVERIGYAAQSIEVTVVSGQTVTVNFQMAEEALALDEVVVSALGVVREARSLGYSVARVNPTEMTVNSSVNFMNALQGKLAGVNVQLLGSGAQGSTKIRIRGQSSMGPNNSPLIVVNGVPIDNTNFASGSQIMEPGRSRSNDSGDGLSSINPDDIVEMTVLKGAAAAALYGSRGQNGVVLITTRSRLAGIGTRIEFSSNLTRERILDHRGFQMEYGEGEEGVRPTTAFPGAGVWSWGEKFLDADQGVTQILWDGIEVPYLAQRNQLHDFYRDGFNATNTISVLHGTESGGVSASFSNLTSRGIYPTADYERNTINLGFTQEVAEFLTLSGNVQYTREDRKNSPALYGQSDTPMVLYTMANSIPMDLMESEAVDDEGDEQFWSRFGARPNPYFTASRFDNNIRDRVFGNITARVALGDRAFVQARVGQDYSTREQDYNYPTGGIGDAPAPPGFFNGTFTTDASSQREVNVDLLAGADRTYGDFGVDLNVGANLLYRLRKRTNVHVTDFYSRNSYTIANGRQVVSGFTQAERQVNSLYAFSQISYLDMLFLTGTVRNDWFSTLSPENRSILYPSVGASFVFTDGFELPDWLSYGKVRVAYAEVGSDTDVPPYGGNLFYRINPVIFEDVPLGSIASSIMPNPQLRPMRVSEWEVGTEMTLWNNVTLEVSWYQRTANEQILRQAIPRSSGYSSRLINIGASQNKGVEALLNFTPVRLDRFSWNVNFNANYNTTKVLDLGSDIGIDQLVLPGGAFHGELRQVTGQPMNLLYGWGWARDDQGRTIFNATTGLPIKSPEQYRIGTSIPKWIGGITNSFGYDNLSMSFLIDFKLGHWMLSNTHMNAARHGLLPETLEGRDTNCIVGDGVNPDGAVNTTCGQPQRYWTTLRSFRASEPSAFKAGSWQLRQITLGYNITGSVLETLGAQALRVNLVANNVAVLKQWVPHIHPDQNSTIDDLEQGIESTGLPITRGLGINVNVVF